MAKPRDFTDDLAVLDTSVKGEVDTILKFFRATNKIEAPHSKTASNDEAATRPPSQECNHQESTPRKVRRDTMRSTVPGLQDQLVLENVTTRLRRATNELLTEAALRQKLKKESPSTRQDIIEFALQEWFRKHGYRSSVAGD